MFAQDSSKEDIVLVILTIIVFITLILKTSSNNNFNTINATNNSIYRIKSKSTNDYKAYRASKRMFRR